MKHVVGILILSFLHLSLQAQDSKYSNPNALIYGYFQAVSDNSDSTRRAMMSELFAEGGLINATVQRDFYQSKQLYGPVKKFLDNAVEFYRSNTIAYEEADRSIDYYQDLALAHSLAFQVIEEKNESKSRYEQWLWFSFNMVYANNRWYLTSVSSVNAFDAQPIDNAMLQDTLWHNPEP